MNKTTILRVLKWCIILAIAVLGFFGYRYVKTHHPRETQEIDSVIVEGGIHGKY